MILIILDVNDRILENRIRHTFNQIMPYLGYLYAIKNKIDRNLISNKRYSLLIYYGNRTLSANKKSIIQIIPNNPKATDIKQKKLHYLKNKNRAVFDHDFVLESFKVLSREEEIESKNIDKHKRFIAAKSNIFTHLKEPIVNKYAIALDKLIKILYKEGNIPLMQKCQWPENRKFAVCLSHDVDNVKFIKSDFLSINKVADFIKGENPYWQFHKVIELEGKYNFKSTFFFCTGKKHSLDPNYSIKEKKIRYIIKFLINKENEVGLHLSYLSYNNIKMIESEKRELMNLVGGKIGARTHFLRFSVPKTLVLEDKSGIYYDSSLGYSDAVGYRSGFCWPYTPYAIGYEKSLNILELPLSVMDGTLFGESKTVDNALRSLKKLFHHVKKYNGVIVMDWHQNVFNEKYFKGWSYVYERCLDYFHREGAFVGPARMILDWIHKRNSVVISKAASQNIWRFRLSPKADIGGFTLKVAYTKNSRLKINNSEDYKITKDKDGFAVTFKKIKKGQNITIDLLNT